jgi:transcription initiation factor TFIIH subunit 2
MADSDGEYIDDEADAPQVVHGGARQTRSSRPNVQGRADWEVTRTWENVVEGADGTINSTVEGLLEAGKRKRLVPQSASRISQGSYQGIRGIHADTRT